MQIKINRIALKPGYTIGRLYMGGDYYCDTLEPFSAKVDETSDRRLIKQMKRTFVTIAIPTGTYRVKMESSQKFGKLMPYLTDVPCFQGVMIHPGNYPRDTKGCILPGWNRRVGMVCGSRSAFAEIERRIRGSLALGEVVSVRIQEAND